MSPQLDEESLARVLSELAATLTSPVEVSEVFYRVAEHVIELLQVSGAGVSVVDAAGRLRPVTGLNRLIVELEATEEQFQEGACVDALRTRDVVAVPDLESEAGRWPRWVAECKRHGVQSVMGVPMIVRDEPIGAVNIYSKERRDWTPSDIRLARAVTDLTGSHLANASELEASRRTAEQLQEALDSRVVIEQAKGMLASELSCTVDQAFEVLRRHARNHGATLRSVAHAVVHLGLRPSR